MRQRIWSAAACGLLALAGCGGGDSFDAVSGTRAVAAGAGGSTADDMGTQSIATSTATTTSSATTATNSSASTGGAGGAGGSMGSSGVGGSGAGCHATPQAADRDRVVVISRPYDAAGNASPLFEVMKLDTTGALTRPGVTFNLDRTPFGHMVFTPDGAIGLVAEDQCTLGVVRFDAEGMPTVVHAKLDLGFCASDVIVEPGGDTAIVLDPDTRANGGGLYRVSIACDGTLTSQGLIAPAAVPGGLVFVANGARAVLAAADVLDSTMTQAAHLLSTGPTFARLGSADAFGGTEAIFSGLAVTHDEAYAIVPDDDQFSGIPNRLGIVKLGASTITPVQVVTPVDDPFDLAASPFDKGSVVVLSGMANAIVEIGYDPTNTAAPFTDLGEIAYTGTPPQLPSNIVTVTRGALTGLALMSENTAVRRLRFEPAGGVTDLGPMELGAGLDQIPGCIGVAP